MAVGNFGGIVGESFVREDKAFWDAQKLRVGEFFARTEFAVIKNGVFLMRFVEFFGGLFAFFADTDEIVLERGDCFWPN